MSFIFVWHSAKPWSGGGGVSYLSVESGGQLLAVAPADDRGVHFGRGLFLLLLQTGEKFHFLRQATPENKPNREYKHF